MAGAHWGKTGPHTLNCRSASSQLKNQKDGRFLKANVSHIYIYMIICVYIYIQYDYIIIYIIILLYIFNCMHMYMYIYIYS